jgi:hypothetical protein
MPDARVGIRVADDQTTVTIEVFPPGQQVNLTLAELDQFVDRLGNRASPPEGVLFGFYHPKFGPVGLTLPKDEIVSIVGFLTDRFILQPAASSGRH